ncbi:glutamine synthetase family protein [Antrihabitans stalactiti]|uniref:glutamine synthetase family protein n=1 Tax=Antrihabitans stalactiti TaxID=2584121 RepID=UPI0030B80A46
MSKASAIDASAIENVRDELAAAGVRSVIGSVVNAAGLTLAKTVPLERLDVFHRAGLGVSPVWHAFCIDGHIAFTDTITAVGDERVRIDIDGVRNLGDGLAWGPADYFLQDGQRSANCARGLLLSIERRLADAGLAAQVGHELEFVLTAPDGSELHEPGWVPYGIAGLLDSEAFIGDLFDAARVADLPIEQLHREYGPNQFEFSLAPATPVAAADSVVLAKAIVGRVARRHNVRPSFSPMPFIGGAGNGAHQHFSLTRDGVPLFGGGSGPYGLTAEGGAVIGGIVANLPAVQGLLTGSVLSGARLAPGSWSGVHLCWGRENREAAVRLVEGGPSNPYGANLEVKITDPSANTYVASATVLALALDGITRNIPLPNEFADDPSKCSTEELATRGVPLLPNDIATVIESLAASRYTRDLLGAAIVDATVATRRHEQTLLDSLADLAERFRLAWTI